MWRQRRWRWWRRRWGGRNCWHNSWELHRDYYRHIRYHHGNRYDHPDCAITQAESRLPFSHLQGSRRLTELGRVLKPKMANVNSDRLKH
jgi:hypothetical protein